ncbi:unnamed protein product [Lupinus luteus]|uniref:DUF4283 domain-containing protein n=1 Tax=Lupinus luteus TaxID=3873 RepID=A0AAV1XAF4_LUPLU
MSTFEEEEDDLVENRWYQEVEEENEFDPCPAIPVSKEEFEMWCKPWKQALVVKLLGLTVSMRVMENRLKHIWQNQGCKQIIDMPQSYFMVHFSNEDDYNHALYVGFWMLANHYLVIQRWRPFFLSNAKVVQIIVVWIHIPYLPIELYNQRFLSCVGASLGKMLKIDQLTSIHSRGKFARICVEMDLAKKIVHSNKVMGTVLNL